MNTKITLDQEGYPSFQITSKEDKILNSYFREDIQYGPYIPKNIIE